MIVHEIFFLDRALHCIALHGRVEIINVDKTAHFDWMTN